jgi:hypothetical protein
MRLNDKDRAMNRYPGVLDPKDQMLKTQRENAAKVHRERETRKAKKEAARGVALPLVDR